MGILRTGLGGALLSGLLVAGVLALGGCGQSPAPSQAPLTANGSGANGAAPKLIGDANAGMKLFQQSCATCHSTGTQRIVGPGLQGLYAKSSLPNGQPVNEVNVMQWIKTGGGGMPSFAQLSNQDRANLAAYLKTLK